MVARDWWPMVCLVLTVFPAVESVQLVTRDAEVARLSELLVECRLGRRVSSVSAGLASVSAGFIFMKQVGLPFENQIAII